MSSSGRDDRADAQRRVNRIRAFRAELDALSAAGVAPLTPEQRDTIRRYHDSLLDEFAAEHDVDQSDAAGRLSRGMQIASFIAAIALTAAVYSLVSRFWGRLDLPVQATLLCAFPLMALVGVELSAQRERTLYIASIFALVAFGTYWLAVAVLSDLLNVPVTTQWLWGGALFGVSLAMPYGFRLILGAALAVFLIAVSGSAFQFAGVPWSATVEYPEMLMVSAFALALMAPYIAFAHPSFAPVTRIVALAIGFLALLVLSLAGAASLLPVPNSVSELIYQTVMLVISVAAIWIGIRRHWLETVYLGAGALTVFLFSRFVDWFWEPIPRYLFFLLMAALAFGWLIALRRLRARLAMREAA